MLKKLIAGLLTRKSTLTSGSIASVPPYSQSIIKWWKIPNRARKDGKSRLLLFALLSSGLGVLLLGIFSIGVYYDISIPGQAPTSNLTAILEPTELDNILKGSKQWNLGFDSDPLVATPAEHEGILYVIAGRTNDSGRLLALDALDGSSIWNRDLFGVSDYSPVVAGDLVFAVLRSGEVFGLNRFTGNLIWSFQADSYTHGPAVVKNGVLYLASTMIYALDAHSGELRWSRKVKGNVNSHLAISDGALAVMSFEGDLNLMSLKHGNHRLTYPVWFGTYPKPLAHNGTLVLAGNNASVIAIDMSVRELPFERIIKSIWATLWMWDMAPRPGSPKGYLWHSTKLQGVRAYPVAADDNSAYVGIRHADASGTIVALDINNGNTEWIKHFDSALTTSAAFVDDFLLISTRSGGLHLIDKYSGESLWNFEIGSKLETAPALGINGIVAVTTGGKIIAIR